MKLTVLGGGGVRSPFLAKSIAYNAHRIGVTEVVFMDTDRQNSPFTALSHKGCSSASAATSPSASAAMPARH